MAKEKINDVNKAGKDIKNTFSEIGNLINELNGSLEKTFSLTKGVSNNLSQSNDLSKEFMDSETNLKGLKETLAGLDEDKQKRLADAMKTGKGLNHELTKELGLQKHIGKLAGAAGKVKLDYLDNLIKKQDESAKREIKANKLKELGNMALKAGNAAADVFLTALMAADKETTAMARGLNMSKEEAIGVKDQFAEISKNSGDIAINSIRLGKANAGLNAQLGMGVQFSGDMLKTFSKLTEVVGISAEAAGSLAFQGQMAGQSFREVEENVLGASYEMQRGVGIQLNMKEVLEATGKVSGQVRANLGATPELIAKAVTAAKLLGAELDTIVNAGRKSLDFESSIGAELEAELLTGKQLNLERMRAAALAGDQATVAAELAKNVGTHGEFLKMNVLQQDALAKAMGMSSDEMANMLFKQETMGMNAKDLRAQGKGELADKLEQLDTQEKLALAQEKFAATMGDIMTFALPIVEGFGFLVGYLAESTTALAVMGAVMAGLAISSLVSAITSIMTTFSFIPLGLGIPLAIATIAGMAAMISSAKSKVKDGHAPASKGPFTITDNYGAMASTTPGDNLQVGPSVGKGSSSQPIVVQNSWDAFAASSSNGRKGLGGTQSLQASPTFA
tara:strand:+ start:1904 stop:3766 length:1863 start_codon:yes stop_codon:yes gene_type:complete